MFQIHVNDTNTLYSLFEINNDATRATTLALDATELPKDNIVEGYNTDRDMNRINEDKVNALNAMAKRVESYLESLQGKTDDSCLINGYDFCIADKDEFLNVVKKSASLKIKTKKEKVPQNSPATATVVKVGVFFFHLKETEKIEKPKAERRPTTRPNKVPI